MSLNDGPLILGISGSHNGAACLLRGGTIICAIQEERLSRDKRDRIYGGRPSLAVQYCLDAGNVGPGDLDLIVFCSPRPLKDQEHDVGINPQLQVSRFQTPVRTISHHLGHGVSAYALSGLGEAAVLVVDGAGSPTEDLSPAEALVNRGGPGTEAISFYTASRGDFVPLEKYSSGGRQWVTPRDGAMPLFGSLGGMYSAVAAQIFGDISEAGKVMGLAPFGEITLAPEEFFSFSDGRFEFKTSVPERFSYLGRWPAHKEIYADLARSVQNALEEALLLLAARLKRITGLTALCYAGGVALNGVANERIRLECGFDRLYVPAAAEDSGPAVGAAYFGHWILAGYAPLMPLTADRCGRSYTSAEVSSALQEMPFLSEAQRGDPVYSETVDRLVSGQLGGWFEGGSELGPRALGQRSIIADPRRPEVKDELNSRIKRREGFRPFAPSILEDMAPEWFQFSGTEAVSPFMLRVVPFMPGRMASVPAVAHVDGSGRVQTVSAERSPAFHRLIESFFERTGVPLLLNTSFNGPGEPIVETPADALWGMVDYGLDFVVIDHRLIPRSSSIKTLLDLAPIAVVGDQLSSLLRAVPQGMGAKRPTEARLLAETLWGPKERSISAFLLEILAHADGHRDGHQLLHQLDNAGFNVDRRRLVSALAKLRAYNLLRFREI